jgi:hypothetical protein
MGLADQQLFINAVAGARGTLGQAPWRAAFDALNRLSMFDMLAALSAVSAEDRTNVLIRGALDVAEIAAGPEFMAHEPRLARLNFALTVVNSREIADFGLPVATVNVGREFLRCTPIEDAGVQRIIDASLVTARAEAPGNRQYSYESCCGIFRYAWLRVLVPQRQAPNGSLISNLAAAAHYMLARYHVCAARASGSQMNLIADGYDMDKRRRILSGDRELRGVAITSNPPFPPDFAIRGWAYRGSAEGERDHSRCNSAVSFPLVPTVNRRELGVVPPDESE